MTTDPHAPRPAAPSTPPSRRDVLKAAGVLAAGTLAGCAAPSGSRSGGPGGENPARSARLIHFTDAHIRPEFDAVSGVSTALAHACSHAGDADAMITGGDMIMYSMDQPEDRVKGLWDLWQTTFAQRCPMRVEHCIGNHDIWGWNKARSMTTGQEPRWGKAWWLKANALERTYKSFDLRDWHVVILDSVQPLGESYQGLIDQEQFAWLERDLAGVEPGRHTLIISHIPILSVGMLDCDAKRGEAILAGAGLDASSPAARALVIQGGAMHMDTHRLLRLFERSGTVRACLSGHIHIVESMRYKNIDFHCSGAVSGMWWRGEASNRRFQQERARAGDVDVSERPTRAEPGYAVVDLMSDGTVAHRYQPIGWKYAQP